VTSYVGPWSASASATCVAARLLLIEDMGHDRPRALWPRVVDAIHEHTEGVTST
jgi:hypothetical protein